MNREIKFRAWDKDKAQMIHPSILEIKHENFAWQYGRDYLHNCQDWGNEDGFIYNPILMQYTGSEDNKGNEIYEGEIILNADTGAKGIVKWDNKKAIFIVEYRSGRSFPLWQALSNCYCSIGNIYEHPELL